MSMHNQEEIEVSGVGDGKRETGEGETASERIASGNMRRFTTEGDVVRG